MCSFTLYISFINGHEFEQTPGDSEGQGSPACSLVCGVTESDTTEQLNNNKVSSKFQKELWPPKRLRIIAKAEVVSLFGLYAS